MRTVLALGGNALQRSGDDGRVGGELQRAHASLTPMAQLLAGRDRLLLTHGNDPQVGHALLRAEAGRPETPERPLDHLVSDTQGGLGYLLERTVREIIAGAGGSVRWPAAEEDMWNPQLCYVDEWTGHMCPDNETGAMDADHLSWALANFHGVGCMDEAYAEENCTMVVALAAPGTASKSC